MTATPLTDIHPPEQALTKLRGVDVRCPPEDVAALLRRRGDKELLSLVTESTP
jgi:hypothetical protein